MTTNNTGGRTLAIATGMICAVCTLAVVSEDVVFHGAALTLKHGMTIAIVCLAMLFGHLCHDAWRRKHRVTGGAFGVLFLVTTMLTVYSSVGRQSEHTFVSAAQAQLDAERRIVIKAALTRAEDMLRTTQDKLQADCVKGKASKGTCDGIRASIEVYDAAVKGNLAELAKLGPVAVVAPDAEAFANLADVLGFDKAKVKAMALLFVPLLLALSFEIGAICSLGYGFRHIPAAVAIDPKWTAQTSFPASNDGLGGLTALLDGTPPTLPPTNTVEPEYKGTDVIDWAEQFHKRHGRAPRGIEAETAFAKQIEAKEISRSTVLRRNDAFRASLMASA